MQSNNSLNSPAYTASKEGFYSFEELLPAFQKLSRKYTSGESSSITYETAQMLMEAVIYRVKQYVSADLSQKADAITACDRGLTIILEKAARAKALYEEIITDFEDYGCRNYRDTILKGMPAFFLRYDPIFAPQKSILTLDYPTFVPISDADETPLQGIDRILTYLERISEEKRLLSLFPAHRIQAVLQAFCPDYEELYLDNLCEPVLLQAVKCFIADRPVQELVLEKEDQEIVDSFFVQNGIKCKKETIVQKVTLILDKITRSADLSPYFVSRASDLAVWIGRAV